MIITLRMEHFVNSMLHGPVPDTYTRWQLQQLPELDFGLPMQVEVPDGFSEEYRITDGVLMVGVLAAYEGCSGRTPEENLRVAINAIRQTDPMTFGLAISQQRIGTDPLREISRLTQPWSDLDDF